MAVNSPNLPIFSPPHNCAIRQCVEVAFLISTHICILYKLKYWREYYLVKHKRKHCDGINIVDFDKIISYMHLNLQLGVILMCTFCLSGIVDMEAKVPL